jgi:hypothetical protein
MGRKLKNYDKYLQKLEIYAQASCIELVWKEEPDDGAWILHGRRVRIDPHLIDSTEIATLCHEIGHSEDDSFYDQFMLARLNRAYSAWYAGVATFGQRQLVFECEERAWRFGRAIAKRLRIPLGRWYDDEEMDALDSYRRR